MRKTVFVLPDGTELTSGTGTVNAIRSVKLTQCVNSGQELEPGAVCASMLEAELITPGGGFSLTAGDELTVYKEDEKGLRTCVGLFRLEQPARSSANSYSLTAFDRVSLLDKDLTGWLAGLSGWPYSLLDFAKMVCTACGVTLTNTQIPNGGYPVRKFSAEGITGRKLIEWAGQIAGRFCRAAEDGALEFAWYTPCEDITVGPSDVSAAQVTYDEETGDLAIESEHITLSEAADGVSVTSEYLQTYDDGNGGVGLVIESSPSRLHYYMNSLTYGDYQVAPIEKVQLRQNSEDVGTVWPDTAEALNTYIVTGNGLLTAAAADELPPVAQVLYEALQDVTYTPCCLTVPANSAIRPGHILSVTDRNGRQFTAYVMTKTQSGQTETLECTGSPRRDSSMAVNNQSFKALSGKVLNLRTDVDGLKAENANTSGKVASLTLDVDNIRSTVTEQTARTDGMNTALTQLQQSATQLSATVKSIQDNGVSKVTNSFGLTIDESFVNIHREGKELTTRLNEEGMYVVRSAGTDRQTTMLQADVNGVTATDVTVNNYLVIGSHARFEDYTDGTDGARTACFYIGGNGWQAE